MPIDIKNGALTERLGSGLQNRPRQFESARHLLSSHLMGGSLNFIYSSLCASLYCSGEVPVCVFTNLPKNDGLGKLK